MSINNQLPLRVCQAFQAGNALKGDGYCGRFAPSPSGNLHLGNIRTALVSWLKARSCGGKWLLRIDDLDTPRNSPGAIQQIQEDLFWLGLQWDDSIIFQSHRKGLYYSVLSFLRNHEKLYPCRCSRRLLNLRLNTSLNQPNIYSGKCRNLDLSWGIEDNKLPSWRLKASKNFANTSGDIVVRRADGLIAYHLATVIDELSFGISEVVRGNDLQIELVSQLAIYDALNQPPPCFAHVPLLFNKDGTKLSKKNCRDTLKNLKEKGMKSKTIIGLLAHSLNLLPTQKALTPLDLLHEINMKDENFDSLLNKSNFGLSL